MAMEFWGVEVKAGESVKCEPGVDKYLHLSQASLGEVKKDKGNDSVVISVKVDDKKLVLGTLSSEKCAQISCDLVFEKEFELSHNWKNGSVYFCGYRTMAMDEDDESDAFMDSESESDEEIPQLIENGKPEVKEEKFLGKPVVKEEKSKPSAEKSKPKPDSLASKPKAKLSEPNKADKPMEDDEDDGDDEDDEDESTDEDMVDAGDDSDDEDDEDEDDEESSEEDEATPKKDEKGKKRPPETETKTPVSGKKAKLAMPSAEKTGANGKKGGQTVTPAKQGGKAPASNDKGKQQTPKSGGQVSCKSCSKKFNSDVALQAHTKAKHSAGK